MKYTEFSKKQIQLLTWWRDPNYAFYDFIICDGAVRSGKSSLMFVSFLIWATVNFKSGQFAICSYSRESVIRNIIFPFFDSPLNRIFNIKMHENYFSVNELKFHIFGGKFSTSYMAIQGLTLNGVFFDEVTLLNREFVNQSITRCSHNESKIWFNCNPQSPDHWFYKEWICCKDEKNVLYMHFKLTDNPALSEKIIERYKHSFSGIFYDRYILGLWTRADGLIYPEFASDNSKYILDDTDAFLKSNRPDILTFGIDFGGAKSATAFSAVIITSESNYAVMVDERYYDYLLSPDSLYTNFAEFVSSVTARCGLGGDTRADSAESILIRGLYDFTKRAKLKTVIRNAKKSLIINRIKLLNFLMIQGRFKIASHCVHTIEALNTAVFDSSKSDTRLDNGSTNIDSLDALEYTLEPYEKILLRRSASEEQ